MGSAPNISHDRFPKQGSWLGREVLVCYNYDSSHQHQGFIVRVDAEEPGSMILRVIVPGEPDRYLRSTECMYSLVPEAKGAN